MLNQLMLMESKRTLFGEFFEFYADAVLAFGGEFRVRNLQTNAESLCTLQKTSSQLLLNLSDIETLPDDKFGEGHSKLEGIDAVTRAPPRIFNMTINLRHTVNESAISQACNLLQPPGQGKIPFYWVVPTVQYEFFGIRPVSDEISNLVDQFAFELDLKKQYSGDPSLAVIGKVAKYKCSRLSLSL